MRDSTHYLRTGGYAGPGAASWGACSMLLAMPRLLDRLRDVCRTRHLSLATEKAYAGWTVRFVRYHGLRHPQTLSSRSGQPRFRMALALWSDSGRPASRNR